MEQQNRQDENINLNNSEQSQDQSLKQKQQFDPLQKNNQLTKNNDKKHENQTKNNNDKQDPSKQNSNESEELSETNDEQVAGFTIIGQDATNQILQVNLYPKEQIFTRGKILYANFDYRDKNQFAGYQSFTQFLKEFVQSGYHPMRKIHNIKSHIVYVGISKGGGKILSVDSEVYGDDIFVNPGKIILSNVNHGNSQVKKHQSLKRFQNRLKVNEKNEQLRTLILLQSLNNNVIVEKYLGVRQKLYVQERLIIGLSGSVKGESGFGRLATAKLQGPGWVFMENDSNSWVRQNKLIVIGMAMVLLIIISELVTLIKL